MSRRGERINDSRPGIVTSQFYVDDRATQKNPVCCTGRRKMTSHHQATRLHGDVRKWGVFSSKPGVRQHSQVSPPVALFMPLQR